MTRKELIEAYATEYGVTKGKTPKQPKNTKYNFGCTAASKSFSKWNQGKAITLRAQGYGTARC